VSNSGAFELPQPYFFIKIPSTILYTKMKLKRQIDVFQYEKIFTVSLKCASFWDQLLNVVYSTKECSMWSNYWIFYYLLCWSPINKVNDVANWDVKTKQEQLFLTEGNSCQCCYWHCFTSYLLALLLTWFHPLTPHTAIAIVSLVR
jgi:hypothetical protein